MLKTRMLKNRYAKKPVWLLDTWACAQGHAQEDEPKNFKHSPGKVVPLCDEMA